MPSNNNTQNRGNGSANNQERGIGRGRGRRRGGHVEQPKPRAQDGERLVDQPRPLPRGPEKTRTQPSQKTKMNTDVSPEAPRPNQDRNPVVEPLEKNQETAATNEGADRIEVTARMEQETSGLTEQVHQMDQPSNQKPEKPENVDQSADVFTERNASSHSGKVSWNTVLQSSPVSDPSSPHVRGIGRGNIIESAITQHQINPLQNLHANDSNMAGRCPESKQVCDLGLSPVAKNPGMETREHLTMDQEKKKEMTKKQTFTQESTPSTETVERNNHQQAPVTKYLNRDIFCIIKKEKLAKLNEIKEKHHVDIFEIPLEDESDPRIQLVFSCSTSDPTSIKSAADELYNMFQETKHEAKSLPAGYQLGSLKVYVHVNNITVLQVQGIVNAANGGLYHAGGVAKAIADKAGPELVKDSRQAVKTQRSDFPTSDVIRTTSGKLPCGVVLHAVGPAWPSTYTKMSIAKRAAQELECVELLKATFDNILLFSDVLSLGSVAVPPISSGISGVPHQHVIGQMTQSIAEFTKHYRETCLKKVHLVDISEELLREISNKLRAAETSFCLPPEDVVNEVVACCDATQEKALLSGCIFEDLPRSYLSSKQSSQMRDRAPTSRPGVAKADQNDPQNVGVPHQKRRADTHEEPLETTFKKNCQITSSEFDRDTPFDEKKELGNSAKGVHRYKQSDKKRRRRPNSRSVANWSGNSPHTQTTPNDATAVHPPRGDDARSGNRIDTLANLSITINGKQVSNRENSRTVKITNQEEKKIKEDAHKD